MFERKETSQSLICTFKALFSMFAELVPKREKMNFFLHAPKAKRLGDPKTLRIFERF